MDAPALLAVLALAAAALVGYLVWRHDQQRRDALRAFTAARGWTFTPRDDRLVRQFRDDFPLFRQGNAGRECRNVVGATTASGLPCLLFDYRYKVRRQTGSGNDTSTSTRTIRHAVAAVELPVALPELRLAPETLLTRLASTVGFRDIELESSEFNRRFRVRSRDRTHAFDVLHPRTIEFLLDQRFDSWELVGRRLLVTTDGRWSLEDYDRVVARLQAFVDLVPDYVWRKYTGEVP